MRRLFSIFICLILLSSMCVPVLGETEEDAKKIYRICGDSEYLGNWEPADDRFIMEEVSPDVYELVLENIPAGSYSITITENGDWVSFAEGSDEFCSFTLAQPLTFTVRFTLIDGIGKIECIDPRSPDEDTYAERTLSLYVPSSWETVYVYTYVPWNTVVFPGVPVEKIDDDYELPIPTTNVTLCISGLTADGTLQTCYDLFLESGNSDIAVRCYEDGYCDEVEWGTTYAPSGDAGPASPETKPGADTEEPVPFVSSNAQSPEDPFGAEPTAPVEGDSAPESPSALVNQPLQSLGVFLFGIIAVFAYLLFLLRRQKKVYGDVSPDGKIHCRSRLSSRAVTKAVKENMPSPSSQLDQRIFDSIKNRTQPPLEP